MAIELANAISAYKSAVGRAGEVNHLSADTSANDFSAMVKNFAQEAID